MHHTTQRHHSIPHHITSHHISNCERVRCLWARRRWRNRYGKQLIKIIQSLFALPHALFPSPLLVWVCLIPSSAFRSFLFDLLSLLFGDRVRCVCVLIRINIVFFRSFNFLHVPTKTFYACLPFNQCQHNNRWSEKKMHTTTRCHFLFIMNLHVYVSLTLSFCGHHIHDGWRWNKKIENREWKTKCSQHLLLLLSYSITIIREITYIFMFWVHNIV